MFHILLTMFAGIGAGYVCRRVKAISYSGKGVTVIVWIMLFMLGAEIGMDRNIVGNLSGLGLQSILFAVAGVAGSVLAAVAVQKVLFSTEVPGKAYVPHEDSPYHAAEAGKTGAGDGILKRFRMFGGTIAVLAFFAAGCIAGLTGIMPFDPREGNVTVYILYVLMLLVGVSIWSNPELKKILKSITPTLLVLPLASIAGTLLFSAAVSLAVSGWGLTDCLAVGSGMGYYSLSSILISQYKEASIGAQLAAELGTVALLANIFRELFTLVSAPVLARKFGPFAPIASAGATAMDVCLPVILKNTGDRMLPAAVISGVISDFSVPLLVPLFCSL